MDNQLTFTANRLFYDTRQLQSFCESGRAQSRNAENESQEQFFDKLHDKLSGYIKDGHNYIAIDGSEDKTPLHCLNTQQYEFANDSVVKQFDTDRHIPYAPSIDPVAAEYTAQQMIEDTERYIVHKEQLKSSLSEDMVKRIIKNDIDLKSTFKANVMDLDQRGVQSIVITYQAGQCHDNSLVNRINDFKLT